MAVAEELKRRSAKRVGIIGFLTWLNSRQLANFDLVDLAEDYRWLRMRKSDEEIDWMRSGRPLAISACKRCSMKVGWE